MLNYTFFIKSALSTGLDTLDRQIMALEASRSDHRRPLEDPRAGQADQPTPPGVYDETGKPVLRCQAAGFGVGETAKGINRTG